MSRCRRPMPSVNPARPPPMMVTGRDILLVFPPGDEQVAEEAGRPFGQNPIFRVRPQGRKFASEKSGADTDIRVVAGDRAAPDRPQKSAGPAGRPGAARFKRD